MPQVNFTIDNVDPLIQYLPPGAWTEGSDTLDPLGHLYSNGGTFTLCTSTGSSASFSFNGSAVWIFGAKRGNHGPYSVLLDNVIYQGDGFSPDPGLFQVPLFNATSLPQGPHVVTITNQFTNESQPYLDIDFITWASDIGTSTENITQTLVQDTDPSFSYQPSASWTTNTGNLQGFNGSTEHATFDTNAFVTYSFTGDGVALFGSVGPQAAPYSVQVDNNSPTTFNGTKLAYTPQVVLYQTDNLGPGLHNLAVVSHPSAFGQALTIDYALVLNVPSVASQDPTQPSPSSSNMSSASSGISGTAIGGIVAGLCILVAILAAIVFILRRKALRKGCIAVSIEQGESRGGNQAVIHPFTEGRLPMVRPLSTLVKPRPPQLDGHYKFHRNKPQAQVSNAWHSDYSQPRHLVSETTDSGSFSTLGATNATNSERQASSELYIGENGNPVLFPPSVGQRLDHVSEPVLLDRRMAVEALPPNYDQAVQPFR